MCADKRELKQYLQKFGGLPTWEWLADYHLLLWISKKALDMRTDMKDLVAAILARGRAEVPHGLIEVITNLAGMKLPL
jgi:hypothetical protein